jgi:tRNA A-37 threonylcarbamoyl transferase component Bud32
MAEISNLELIFFAALERADPAERAAYLDRACAGDADLRARVERLLAARPQVGSFLEAPAPAPPAGQPTNAESPSPPPGITSEDNRPQEAVGTVIAGRYKLLQKLGEGGMGSVFLAEQTEPVQRKVAVKLIKPGMDSAHVLARFEAERQALALMDHPNIAKVLDAGATNAGRPFFVMELVKGIPITRYCDQERLTPRERLELFVPICHAVQHAHQKGVIHRDLKPSNVLIALYDGKPVPKVIDFGVAKATAQKLTERTLFTEVGQFVGTLEYMSPEQAELNQLDVDTRSDVYSLGVLLYELLTGSPPFTAKQLRTAGFEAMLRMIREQEPPRPSTRLTHSDELPSLAAKRKLDPKRLARQMKGDLDWIVMKCLEKERSRRYETANGLAADVGRYLADEPVQAGPPGAGYRLRKFVRRNKGRLAATAAILVAVLGGSVDSFWQVAERQRDRANTAARDRRTAEAALDRTDSALKAGNLAETRTALNQAEPLSITDAELQARFSGLAKDLEMAHRLDSILEQRWIGPDSEFTFDPTTPPPLYLQAFADYGLSLGEQSPEVTAEKLRQSRIAGPLLTALNDWFFLEPGRQGLRDVLDVYDPNPTAVAIRAAATAGQDRRIREIMAGQDKEVFTPEFAAAFGLSNALADDQGLRLMRATWDRRPNSFPLAMAIVSRLYHASRGDGEGAIEAAGWCRTAIALRPDSATAYYWLSVNLNHSDQAASNAALEQTVRLAPHSGYAAIRLGLRLLKNPRDYPAAARLFDSLVRDNPISPVGYIGKFFLRLQEKNWVEAAAAYRRIVELVKEHGAGRTRESFQWRYAAMLASQPPDILIKGLIDVHRPGDAFEYFTLTVEGRGTGVAGLSTYELYNGACLAALLAAEKGDTPPEGERQRLRDKCFEWLTRDLASRLAADRAANRAKVNQYMTHWLADDDLASVRDDKALAQLPAEEQARWRKLWADVRSLRDRTAPGPQPGDGKK